MAKQQILTIPPQDRVLERSFGMVKLKKSAQQIKDEIREELHCNEP